MKQLKMKIMLLFGLALLLSASDSFALNPGPWSNGNKPGRDKGGRGVPLDGGATLLLAAGAAYGLKRLKDNRNTKA